jgi:hypothetical protein
MDSEGSFSFLSPDWAALIEAGADAESMAEAAVSASQIEPRAQPSDGAAAIRADAGGSGALGLQRSPGAASAGSSAAAGLRRLEPSAQPGPTPKRARSGPTALVVAEVEEVPDIGSGGPGLAVSTHMGNWNATLRWIAGPASPGGSGSVAGRVWSTRFRKWAGVVDAQCQKCDLKVSYDQLTSQSRLRVQRRLCRLLQSSAAQTIWGSGAILCQRCGRGDYEPPKQFIAELSAHDLIEAQLTLRLVCRDQNMCPVDESVTVAVGKDSQKKMEQILYARAAARLQSHFADCGPVGRFDVCGGDDDTDEQEP